MWIHREKLEKRIGTALQRSPIVALVGPRQCGKTALARRIANRTDENTNYFDLEYPPDLRSLEAPALTLENLRGLVVIDEIQRKPELFPILRVLADRENNPARFLILGSASPDLIRQGSESLAGRIEFVRMTGFSLQETGANTMNELWVRGGFPLSYLASSEDDSYVWRRNFLNTFLERDIRMIGIETPPKSLRRFWAMLATVHGEVWNASKLSASLGCSSMTARRHLDVMSGAYMVRVLQPWHENIKKRQVKSPKVYIRDSGLLHALLEIKDNTALASHIKRGSSWEGFALEQILQLVKIDSPYFWGVHSNVELDLLGVVNGKRYGFEFKCNDAPSKTRSMEVALQELGLHHLYVVYPGKRKYALTEKISASPLTAFVNGRLVE